jgi:hypothetical protein
MCIELCTGFPNLISEVPLRCGDWSPDIKRNSVFFLSERRKKCAVVYRPSLVAAEQLMSGRGWGGVSAGCDFEFSDSWTRDVPCGGEKTNLESRCRLDHTRGLESGRIPHDDLDGVFPLHEASPA